MLQQYLDIVLGLHVRSDIGSETVSWCIHFDDYDGDQDHDHNIEAVCEDNDPRTI